MQILIININHVYKRNKSLIQVHLHTILYLMTNILLMLFLGIINSYVPSGQNTNNNSTKHSMA